MNSRQLLRETLGAELHRAAFPAWSAALSAFELGAPIAFEVRVVLEESAQEAEAEIFATMLRNRSCP